MYSTTVYLYQQITKVLLIDTGGDHFTYRYDPVYAKTLTVNKGVDNVLLFEFINQDQKPVNITGSTFVFRLIDQSGGRLLLVKDMETLSASTGRVKFQDLCLKMSSKWGEICPTHLVKICLWVWICCFPTTKCWQALRIPIWRPGPKLPQSRRL